MLAGALVAGVSTPAMAAAGDPGNVLNNNASHGDVYIFKSTGPGLTLTPGQWSATRTAWNWQVKKFSIQPGCRARSQYSPSGSYPYGSGTYYNVNGLSLNIIVVC
jgi:hypothetical protein